MKNKKYSFEFKMEVVKAYLNGEGGYNYLMDKYHISSTRRIADWMTEISYQDLAIKFGINNPSLPNSWVLKFRKEGIEGLSKSKGRSPKMEPNDERTARIIRNLRESFKLNEIVAALKFPKSTYMYWKKRFDMENPDKEIEEEILSIREEHKD